MILKDYNLDELQYVTKVCNELCVNYNWLLSAYVLDYFTDNHWEKLPVSWQESLKSITPQDLAQVISTSSILSIQTVLPLSLLSLRKCIESMTIRRSHQIKVPTCDKFAVFPDRLFKEFWRRVKFKKRHEIEYMAKLCHKLASESNCNYIVDVGSGLGHLSRLLAYRYGLKVCGIDANGYLTEEARKLDLDLHDCFKRHFNSFDETLKPTHIHFKVPTNSSTYFTIIQTVQQAFGVQSDDGIQFGIVGLHPCGDLGPTLIRLFTTCPNVKFINVVGCCYMKLSSSFGYPLSNFCKAERFGFDYSVLELACHAIESYVKRLESDEDHKTLKIHAYRAELEKHILKGMPHMRHSQVSNVKYNKDMDFTIYCGKALSKHDIRLSKLQTQSVETLRDLENWKLVVIFYSLRLMLAPVVETVITLDRLLYLLESGVNATIKSIFDPELSPRNHVLSAIK